MTLSLFLGLGDLHQERKILFAFFLSESERERGRETTTVDETRAKERAEREIRALFSKEGLVCVEKRGRRRPLEW